MGTGIPLLNEYKRDFFYKRLPQTILGGPKLKIGYDAPLYVYINQVVVFIIPFILGGIFTLVSELAFANDSQYIGCIINGCLIAVFVFAVQIISALAQRQEHDDFPLPTKKNILAEEDEIDFMSCCGIETFEFVVPKKKFLVNVFVHALIGGCKCGLGLCYLLPTNLNALYSDNIGATVVIYILGWLTLCIAQYPLTVGSPPEPATFRPMDRWELSSLTRPLYVGICLLFDILYRYVSSSDFLLTNQILHIVFICLPLLWTVGLLPPIDVVFFWFTEQVYIFLLGGSPVASGLRLIVYFILAAIVYITAYFVTTSLASVIICSIFGYILSLNLASFCTQLWNIIRQRNKVNIGDENLYVVPEKWKFLWRWGTLEVLYHIGMLAVTGVLSGLLNYNAISFSSIVWKSLGYTIIGLCVVEKIFRDGQNVFVFFGLIRNILYPSSVMSQRMFLNSKQKLKVLGIMRRIIMSWVAPLVMLSYLSVLITSSSPSSVSLIDSKSTLISVWFIFGTVRIFRWIWQNTVCSLLELSVTHVILLTMTTDATVVKYGVPILSLLIGLCRDRFTQTMNKLFLCASLLISSWTDKKQRRKSTAVTIFLSIIFFPVILGIILFASALSAPLLPLFTLPLFFIAFPRPNKFWPESVGASANSCPDSMFYKQFMPKFSHSIRRAFADGSLGEPVAGNHYLVRFQDRLAWMFILERGYGYCVISLKGLELQETSCHTAEAARLDDIFEEAFEKGSDISSRFNHYPLHSLTPLDAFALHTYSDARNVLTGVIDSPDSFKMTLSCLAKALVWVLLHHVAELKAKKKEKIDLKRDFSANSLQHEKNVMELQEINHNKNLDFPVSKQTQVVSIKRQPSVHSIKRKSSWASIDSFADSLFSDDGFTSTKPKPVSKPTVKKKEAHVEKDDLDELFEELEFGLPASDVLAKPKFEPVTQKLQSVHQKSKTNMFGNSIYKPVTNLAGSPDFKCTHSANISLPLKWRELPVEMSQLTKYLPDFPKDWYKFVLGTLDWKAFGLSGEKVALEVGQDETLMQCYTQLVMACYSIFSTNASFNSANTLYKFYIGDLPFNAMLDWLSENKDLYSLVLKSYRYGFKLMLDQILLGEASTNEEIQEYFEEYDKFWYLGLETDPEWKTSCLASKQNLFSLGYNNVQSTYSSRVLSLQNVITHVGRMNSEVVKAQWANLSLELLYFTNDDEERYSIQAHPHVLRNLTVQSADPPLGYPIYSSEPIHIPTV